jgi:hypothetical protein
MIIGFDCLFIPTRPGEDDTPVIPGNRRSHIRFEGSIIGDDCPLKIA